MDQEARSGQDPRDGYTAAGIYNAHVCRSGVSIYFQENMETQVHAKTEGVYLAVVG